MSPDDGRPPESAEPKLLLAVVIITVAVLAAVLAFGVVAGSP